MQICQSLVLLFFAIFDIGSIVYAVGTEDGLENWGYAEVRSKAYMFWLLYTSPYKTQNSTAPWPVILWLQGGPGVSGVGKGNFEEIGPLDVTLKPRTSTWLNNADLLFVDSPVGTGFSYVDDPKLLVKNDEEAAADLTTLLIQLFNSSESLQKSPLYIVGESYGGKHAVPLALSALDAIQAGLLKTTLGGVILGNSWISPAHYTSSWGPLLRYVSRMDEAGLRQTNSVAKLINRQIAAGDYVGATNSFLDLGDIVTNSTNGVDVFNFNMDYWNDPLALQQETTQQISSIPKRYATYLTSLSSDNENDDSNLTTLMNGAIRDKLKIIPSHVTWEFSSDAVFNASAADFMKPRIEDVDLLLEKGVNVTIYNGQLDVMCSTIGTERWVAQLKWSWIQNFLSTQRNPIYYKIDDVTKLMGFYKFYEHLKFFWILGAGHFAPVDRPIVTMDIIGYVINSPASPLHLI